MHPHRMLVAAAAGVTALIVAGTAAAAVPATTEIKPGALPRGADIAIPHLDDKTVVDGDVRIRVRSASVRLLGKSGSSYVVNTLNRDFTVSRLLRLESDGSRTVIAEGDESDLVEPLLSSDGLLVVAGAYRNDGTTLRAWSVATGEVEAKRRFRGYPGVLDVGSPGTELEFAL